MSGQDNWNITFIQRVSKILIDLFTYTSIILMGLKYFRKFNSSNIALVFCGAAIVNEYSK